MSISPVSKSRDIVLKILVTLVLPLWAAQGCGHTAPARSTQQARLDAHLEHYWDTTNLASLRADELEQRLVDYIYLSMNAATERRHLCWQTIARLFPNEQPNPMVVDYLGEPASPLYAPAMLEEYLASIADLFDNSSPERYSIDYLLNGLRKNKAGTTIADLDLISADEGRPLKLHSLLAGKNSKVLFYDPECEECHAMITRMAASDTLNVVAVSVTGKPKALPHRWHSCLAADPDQLDERFFLPRLPQLYRVRQDLVVLPQSRPL